MLFILFFGKSNYEQKNERVGNREYTEIGFIEKVSIVIFLFGKHCKVKTYLGIALFAELTFLQILIRIWFLISLCYYWSENIQKYKWNLKLWGLR